MKLKSILTKTVATAALSLVGIVAINNANQQEAHAAIVQNDASVYTVYTSTTVYNNYNDGQATGQVLAPNTAWKIIKTAYDRYGNKWYDLGKNQWVKVVTTSTTSSNTTSSTSSNTTSSTSSTTSSTTSSSSSSSYTSTATGSEASAKAWIAQHESGGSYTARNGQYIGKYQLSASLLNGNYSASNQEKVADQYVKSRYGSWVAAKAFWESHGWY